MLVALVTSSQKGSEVRPGPSKTSKMEILKRIHHSCFPVKFPKFLTTSVLENNCDVKLRSCTSQSLKGTMELELTDDHLDKSPSKRVSCSENYFDAI